MNPPGMAQAFDSPLESRPGKEHPPTTPSVPDYDLLRRIGGGAYGEVWLARSKATGALRAAKIVWRRTFEDERPYRREFEGIQRFEQISREHPSQLALFHIGRNDPEGYFYYVMELADDWGNGVLECWSMGVMRPTESPNTPTLHHSINPFLTCPTPCALSLRMGVCLPPACWKSGSR
jgi:hypothetical protein